MMNQHDEKVPFLTRVVEVFLRGDVAVLLIVVSVAVGMAALWATPREEEPQIVVPLADVFVSAPGLSAAEIEQKITTRLEKLLYQIDGVEYVYSMSRRGQSIVTVRFYVGEDREDSLLKLYNKIHSNIDRIPQAVEGWVVKPAEVDDVPILNITLWSERPGLYGDHELRRLAEQIQNELQAVPNTNQVHVIGGRPRVIRVELDPVRLAGRKTSALQVVQALKASNVNVRAGAIEQQNRQVMVDAGEFVRDAEDLGNLVINLSGDRPVYLKDVATLIDGPAEVESYTWIGFGVLRLEQASAPKSVHPAVTCRRPVTSCFPRFTSPWPSAKARTPFGSRRRCKRECARWREPTCPTACSTASPATTARRPTRKWTSWSRAWWWR